MTFDKSKIYEIAGLLPDDGVDIQQIEGRIETYA